MQNGRRTLYRPLPIEPRAHHPNSEVKDCQREDSAEAKADPPNSIQMVLSSSRDYDQEYYTGQGNSKLSTICYCIVIFEIRDIDALTLSTKFVHITKTTVRVKMAAQAIERCL